MAELDAPEDECTDLASAVFGGPPQQPGGGHSGAPDVAGFLQQRARFLRQFPAEGGAPAEGAEPAGGKQLAGSVDLNDESVPDATEDPQLRAHMDRARASYQQCLQDLQAVPAAGALRLKYAEMTGVLAETLRGSDAERASLGTASDEIAILARHLDLLRCSAQPVLPHFEKPLSATARADPSVAGVLAALAGLLRKNSAAFTAHEAYLKKTWSDFSRARQKAIEVCDGLLQREEAQTRLIAEQRELLAAAAPVINREQLAEEASRRSVMGGRA